MGIARIAISAAARSDAGTFSKKLFRKSTAFYDSAMRVWQEENNKFIYSRNYDRVEKYAVLTIETARQASDSSRQNASDLRSRVESKITSLSTLSDEINNQFARFPLPDEVRNNISRGKMLLKESEFAFHGDLLLHADEKITESEQLLTDSYKTAFAMLERYFQSYPRWKKLYASAINESKKSSHYSIIVDKYSRKVYVYFKGVKQQEFTAELGKNWIEDKRMKGDNATPEGRYTITRKLNNGRTKYYKALLLDYPNESDKLNFRSAVARGLLPEGARIGNMIEIHGNGGKGSDWTEGCIALIDSDMDRLFKIAEPGMQVTIVGSMHDLGQLVRK